MQDKQEISIYNLQDIIGEETAKLDGIISKLRASGSSGLKKFGMTVEVYKPAPDEIVREVTTLLKGVREAMDKTVDLDSTAAANVTRLINILIGRHTRLHEWADKQGGIYAPMLRETYIMTCSGTRTTSVHAKLDRLHAVVNAEAQPALNICFVLPFLQRMKKSDNFKDGRVAVEGFYDKLVEFRRRLIALNSVLVTVTTPDELLAFYSLADFLQCQQLVSNLAYEYDTKIKPLLVRANIESKDIKNNFNWHLGEDAVVCIREFQQLDRTPAVIQLIKAMENSEIKTRILEKRHAIFDRLLGQRIMREMADSISKARGFIAHLDASMPIIPKQLQGNAAFCGGCMEELFVTADPNKFKWSPDRTNFMISATNTPIAIELALDTRVAGPELLDLIEIFKHQSTASTKAATYCRVIALLRSSVNVDRARAMAEQLLLYVCENSLLEVADVRKQLEAVAKIIATGTFEGNVAKSTEIGMIGDIRLCPVQTLFKDLYKPDVLAALNNKPLLELRSRVAQAYKEEITLWALIRDKFDRMHEEYIFGDEIQWNAIPQRVLLGGAAQTPTPTLVMKQQMETRRGRLVGGVASDPVENPDDNKTPS